MEITLEKNSPLLILTLRGKLGAFFGVKELQDILQAHLDDKIKFIMMNMAEVPYLSSAGIRIILEVRKKLLDKDGALILFHLQPSCAEILKVTGIIDELHVTSNRQEADAFLATRLAGATGKDAF